ncbi:DUF3360 domain-containing protein [Clostridium sp. SYSU_GA19001]|uniref:DUF3360 family protein n=1 Tax=Clostridium caldaquaticum TaxID=2940653 RepID=UPI0020777315|nr:DUF3360 family protein [Clostridium caldaquaticum]MCM8710912.1 DUF3360 domain-containing protein [Clostridium caldaquaticum]
MAAKQSRKDLLTNELINYNPLKYKINIPIKNYSVRFEDIVPAISGTIGKIALVAAFAIAWEKGLGISDATFVTENVRLEVVIGSIITLIFSSILNPYTAPPGTLAPLIPLIPIMAVSGVHPLILGILVGILGIIISSFKLFEKIIEINGSAARGSIILLFGIMGIISSIDSLKKWTALKSSSLFAVLIILGIVIYLVLNKYECKWLMIPSAAFIGIVISAFYNLYPEIKTLPALPIFNPKIWWFNKWGLGWGVNLKNIVKALPFALLSVVMWPSDALAIKTLQETSYGEKAKKSIFHLNSTFIVVSIRNIVGSFFGGAQTAAVWRSFMIPLSIVKRPIAGSALILGILGIVSALLGFPLDIAVFPPLIWMVLIFGVYIPLIEIGLNTLKSYEDMQIAALSILAGFAVNPVIAWITAILIENLGIIKEKSKREASSAYKVRITLIVSAITMATYFVSTIL